MMEKHIGRLISSEAHEYYTPYIDLVGDESYMRKLIMLHEQTPQILSEIPMDRWMFRYAPDKWTIKEVLMHIIDTERIFNYRALRISRGDQTPMASFDQDAYVIASNANDRSGESLLKEYQTLRASTIALFKSFSDEMLIKMGTTSGKQFSPLAIGYIIAGHEIHHMNIIQKRYLQDGG